jgi:hypothetical protein
MPSLSALVSDQVLYCPFSRLLFDVSELVHDASIGATSYVLVRRFCFGAEAGT